MHVRFATPNDIEICQQLDTSFETRRVWQLDLRESREQVSAHLRTTTLPRELRLDYPAPGNALLMHWQRGYALLVAEDWLGEGIVGYADVGPEPDLQAGSGTWWLTAPIGAKASAPCCYAQHCSGAAITACAA